MPISATELFHIVNNTLLFAANIIILEFAMYIRDWWVIPKPFHLYLFDCTARNILVTGSSGIYMSTDVPM